MIKTDYREQSGFMPKHPDTGDLLQCYIQRHYPDHICYVFIWHCESVAERMSRENSTLKPFVWQEYTISPLSSLEDAEKLYREDKGRDCFIFVRGERWIPDTN